MNGWAEIQRGLLDARSNGYKGGPIGPSTRTERFEIDGELRRPHDLDLRIAARGALFIRERPNRYGPRDLKSTVENDGARGRNRTTRSPSDG